MKIEEWDLGLTKKQEVKAVSKKVQHIVIQDEAEPAEEDEVLAWLEEHYEIVLPETIEEVKEAISIFFEDYTKLSPSQAWWIYEWYANSILYAESLMDYLFRNYYKRLSQKGLRVAKSFNEK